MGSGDGRWVVRMADEAGILVEALRVVHAHFHRHALEELEGVAAQV